MSGKKVAIVLGMLLLVTALVLALTQNRPATAAAIPTGTAPAPTRTVNVAAATPLANLSERAATTKVAGNLVSANQVALAFEMPGRVKQISVREGAHVKAGTLLAALDTSLLEFQVAQAQAALDAANAALNRAKDGPTADEVSAARAGLDSAQATLSLAQAAYDRIGGGDNPYIGMLPESLVLQQASNGYRAAVATYNLTVNHPTATELKTVQAAAAQAQAALDSAKQILTNAKIIAPFDGTVLSVVPKAGEFATPGAPAIVLADLSQMQVQVAVDERLMSSLKVGQKVTMTGDALGDRRLTGTIEKIGLLWVATGGVVNAPVTIDLDVTDAPVYSGMSVTVEFPTAN